MGLLGDADDRDRIERHASRCGPCAERLDEIRRLLQATAETPVPEPDVDFERRIWRRQRRYLAERAVAAPSPPVAEDNGGVVVGFWSPGRLALVGALAASLVVAFVAGLYTPPPGMEIVPRGSADSGRADRVLLVAVGGHLESARMVLIELANADGAVGSAHSARAEQLLGDNRLYRQTATLNGQAALAGLLDELERILLEVARSANSAPAPQLDWLRQRIEARDLLFRASVFEGQARGAIDNAPAEGI